MSEPSNEAAWGLLPGDILTHIEAKEWRHTPRLQARLLGEKPFPIRIPLKAPDGRTAINDLGHFQLFVDSWKSYPHPAFVEWETRSYRALLEQRVPRFFTLHSIQDVITALGKAAEVRSQKWQENMAPLLHLGGRNIYAVLVKHLSAMELLSLDDCQRLARLAAQLSPAMGAGHYLRALPIIGIDSKFLESHQSLLRDLLDAMHDGAISQAGGLMPWLDCRENPKGWLCVRPLCSATQQKMGGFPIVQLPTDVLSRQALPARNIIVVENMQSGLGLPQLSDTVAVFGGGKNVAWMKASWLQQKRVAYWGDIDSWGLAILSDVREKLPSVSPLMMDINTLEHFATRMVEEPAALATCPEHLNESEKALFFDLRSGRFGGSRLEQERLSADYIALSLRRWLLQ